MPTDPSFWLCIQINLLSHRQTQYEQILYRCKMQISTLLTIYGHFTGFFTGKLWNSLKSCNFPLKNPVIRPHRVSGADEWAGCFNIVHRYYRKPLSYLWNNHSFLIWRFYHWRVIYYRDWFEFPPFYGSLFLQCCLQLSEHKSQWDKNISLKGYLFYICNSVIFSVGLILGRGLYWKYHTHTHGISSSLARTDMDVYCVKYLIISISIQ